MKSGEKKNSSSPLIFSFSHSLTGYTVSNFSVAGQREDEWWGKVILT